MFVPGVPEDGIATGGLLASGYLTTTQGKVDQFVTDLYGADLPPVLLRSPDSPVTGPVLLTGIVVAARCATQRRRNRR